MRKRIKLFGERNTNTNYLSQLMARNLDVDQMPGVVPRILGRYRTQYPGGERLRDLYFALASRHCYGWKHGCVSLPADASSRAYPSGPVCFVTISKNPYSWLLSLHRNPYHQYGMSRMSFERFLTAEWKMLGRDGWGDAWVSSPIELWNIKNRSYLDLRRFQVFSTTTERLLADPRQVITELAAHFEIERTGVFRNVDRSTKATEQTFADYQAYYGREAWRSLLSADAIEAINAAVDISLMRELGYAVLQPSDGGAASPGHRE